MLINELKQKTHDLFVYRIEEIRAGYKKNLKTIEIADLLGISSSLVCKIAKAAAIDTNRKKKSKFLTKEQAVKKLLEMRKKKDLVA